MTFTAGANSAHTKSSPRSVLVGKVKLQSAQYAMNRTVEFGKREQRVPNKDNARAA